MIPHMKVMRATMLSVVVVPGKNRDTYCSGGV